MLKAELKQTLESIEIGKSRILESDFSFRTKYLELKRLLERICKEMTKEEVLQFPNLFSRLVFIAQQHHIPQQLEQGLQQLRIVSNFLLRDEKNVVSEQQLHYAEMALHSFISFLLGGEYEMVKEKPDSLVQNETVFLDKIRVQVVDIDQQLFILVCRPLDVEAYTLSVRMNATRANAAFNTTFEQLWVGAQLNLIDCKVDNEGFFVPSIIVLEPDYMIDASAIAECFQNYGSSHLHYFRRKFEPIANSHYLLLGNLANFFLDELIYADRPQELDFNDVFLKSFKEMPFEFTSCKDIEEPIAFRDFMSRAQQQFNNIKRVVAEDMPKSGFSFDKVVLEPSFYSEKYGFQGRLDMLQIGAEDGFSRIVELKSGKTPWPQDDVTKIASNHETQTSVYRLMIQSVLQKSAREIHAMILYSSSNIRRQNLRLSAPYKQLEKDILNTRNLIVATEHQLYTGNEDTAKSVFEDLFNLESYDREPPNFFQEKLSNIKKVLLTSSKLERAYFYRFVSFVTRELYLLKVGDEGFDSSMSLSSLWNTSFRERKEALELVDKLTIGHIEDREQDMIIRFERCVSAADFVNFREGEICIVYPKNLEEDSILSNQILKGTIIEISASSIVVRFRYKQKNRSYFTQNQHWTIEHDKLDHSYNAMYKSLFAFLQATPKKKKLLLGLIEPKSSYKVRTKEEVSKEEKQNQVIEKAVASEDYFLIVGPPGTGKTSIFARKLIERFYEQPDVNILVMAYTNRAVDELCAAICAAFGEEEISCNKYIRIGSEYSCAENYSHRLLQNISRKAVRRDELLDTLNNTRIYVGTLASIVSKPELFDIKHFDVAIIDEASQILEPQIIGLLPLFGKFIMIGDHKQLSTITLQNEFKSIVENTELNKIELFDCRESIFERLYRTTQKKGWTSAYETLDYHGRMHEDIAELVNKPFYDGKLLTATNRQSAKLQYKKDEKCNEWSKLSEQRVVFFDVTSDLDYSLSAKTSMAEAELIVELTKKVFALYIKNKIPFDATTSIGIIAPYRNQIALIRHLLEKTDIPELQNIMVDTVERYQGSQREVIILSFCFNHPYQMQYFANMNREGTVDRKLNVALTRAREQLFLVGNRKILCQNKLYDDLIMRILE